MHLSELKTQHVSQLIEMANGLEIESANRLRKQELMFAILKKRAKTGETIFGDGTLEVLPDVYKQIVLRRGDKVCALRADRFDPNGTQPGGGSGTISADVIRVRARK